MSSADWGVTPHSHVVVHDWNVTNWTRLLVASAMYRFPATSVASPTGPCKSAEVPSPVSPEVPDVPVLEPAMVATGAAAPVAPAAKTLMVFALALLAGSLNLDAIAAMQLENGAVSRVGVGIALAATLLVTLVGTMRREMLVQEFDGPDLALLDATDAMRLLVWFNLIGAMFLIFAVIGLVFEYYRGNFSH